MYKVEELEKDIVIVGGGAAGCYAAIRAKELDEKLDVLIVEKADIKRSGCLAAGINAINAYLDEGADLDEYLKFVENESYGLVRGDLVKSQGALLNRMTKNLESYGLTIQKDSDGKYIKRGKRSIKINGENIKPILAHRVDKSKVEVENKCVVVDFIKKDDRIAGIVAFSLENEKILIIWAKAVICTTGGASGIYGANLKGEGRHKMWYPPFNVGSGFAMGYRAGAAMTTLEMRFIALRTRDTISPTGTIAQGVGAKQVNVYGDEYIKNYEGKGTAMRLYATLEENRQGRGPCYLNTAGIDDEKKKSLEEAYLSMSPSIVLKWQDENIDIQKEGVEISGSEPYLVGGHGQAGYWVDKNRRTTVKGLWAAGDVAGGAPKKYVTGSMAEGHIAIEDAIEYIKGVELEKVEVDPKYITSLHGRDGLYSATSYEKKLQSIMDRYAGGIEVDYKYTHEGLKVARKKLQDIEEGLDYIEVKNSYDLMRYFEVRDKLLVAKGLIEHLDQRKETRWRCYQENSDFNKLDNENYFKYINSTYKQGSIKIGEVEGSISEVEFEW